jgi:phage-related protein (TIGR01555 family)
MGLISWLFAGSKPQPVAVAPRDPRRGLFSTNMPAPQQGRTVIPELPGVVPMRRQPGDGTGMDSFDDEGGDVALKAQFGSSYAYDIPDAQIQWYAKQGFIGYQLCAILAQHWLIDKACSMPSKDAVRKGWDISANDGVNLPPEVFAYIRKIDKKFRIKKQLTEYIRFGRIFGIRIMKFVVENNDPLYYERPFNIDGIGPYQYKGMVQIDPYWVVPELVSKNVTTPGEPHFYEPEFWRINGQLIHRTHLCIFIPAEVADVLKPAYYFGGVSVPQRIYERVYASERTANEAPMLAMTKRLTVLSTDVTEAIANEVKFNERMQWFQETRDNYGVKINGIDDKLEQFDISLTDLDSVIMTQFQLVAAQADVPGTKLLGTQPKGFNSTGEFEESSYHEFLESMQSDDMEPVLDRHYELVIKSWIMPKFNCPQFEVGVSWMPLDAMTAQEQAGVNATKAATDAALISAGVIEPQDARDRIVADRDSGYNGMPAKMLPMPDNPAGEETGAEPGQAGGTRAQAAGVAAKLPTPRQHAEAGS